MLLAFAMSLPTWAGESEGLTTILLVPRADMPDSSFRGSVVLVMNNLGPAPAGIIVNRPTKIPVSRLFPDLERLASFDDKLYFGGPVESGSVSFVFRADSPPDHAIKVLDGVYFSADEQLLRKLLGRDKPMEGLRIFIGYSGWAPGQLESEIARGDWTLAPADPAVIFGRKSEHPWPEQDTTADGQRT